MDKHDRIGVFTLCIITGLVCFYFGVIFTCNDFDKRPRCLPRQDHLGDNL